jgi:hypothetical protein
VELHPETWLRSHRSMGHVYKMTVSAPLLASHDGSAAENMSSSDSECRRNYSCMMLEGEPGSPVSIVSGYGLVNQTIEVRSPAEGKDFSSIYCVQTGSEAHPASCTMGTGGPFHGAKVRPGRDADHSPSSSAVVENEYELYLLSPQAPSWRVVGQL